MKIWFDTEFIEDGRTIELISIGMVAEVWSSAMPAIPGLFTYYAESSECDLSRASEWVQTNVIAHLTGERKTRAEIRDDILSFAGPQPQFWAYYADYDWVALCQLFGTMMDLPKGWPMYCRDVKQLCDARGNPKLPEQESVEHNALEDAKWTKQAYDFLRNRPIPNRQDYASLFIEARHDLHDIDRAMMNKRMASASESAAIASASVKRLIDWLDSNDVA